MIYRVRLSAHALADLDRLPDFLEPRDAVAAAKVRERLREAVASLAEFPNRGRRTTEARLRDLPVEFGRYGNIIRYGVSGSSVLVVRMFHVRERR